MGVALAHRSEDKPLTEGIPASPDEGGDAPKFEPLTPTGVRLVWAIALGTGLSSFLYEISWIRLLRVSVLANSLRSSTLASCLGSHAQCSAVRATSCACWK